MRIPAKRVRRRHAKYGLSDDAKVILASFAADKSKDVNDLRTSGRAR